MKKVLLAGTALVAVAIATPASAELKLDLGGYFSGYGVFTDNDETAATSLREFDLRRDTEVHVSGETTLDNGLTVGFHTEQALGGATQTDEAYAYFSGGWGRVNLGSEDGAAYLLQVGAPGADSNIDGLRTYIQALNPRTDQTTFYRLTNGGATTGLTFSGLDATFGGGTVIDYDNADFANTDRISYLTPKFSGFQAGVSYAPEAGQNAVGNNVAPMVADNTAAAFYDASVGATTVVGATDREDLWEAGVRWDGEFQGFGISVGGGYATSDIEASSGVAAAAAGAPSVAVAGDYGITDGTDTWNAGLALTWNGFSLGGAYLDSTADVAGVVLDASVAAGTSYLVSGEVERKTWVVGGAWDNGPYHLGVSYLEQETELPSMGIPTGVALAAGDVTFAGGTNEVKKTTIGGGYTFGPGMTFRGSVAFGDFDTSTGGATDNDFQQVAIGTQIDF